jgi:hypothetical protein
MPGVTMAAIGETVAARAISHLDGALTRLATPPEGTLREVWKEANEHAWSSVVQLRSEVDQPTNAIDAVKMGTSHLEENMRIFDSGGDPFINFELFDANAEAARTKFQEARDLLAGTTPQDDMLIGG